jgi:hypothetical protein
MGLQAIPSQRHAVQVLTTTFQFNGQLETIGPVGNFINDPGRESIALHDVSLAPLTPGSPLRGIVRPQIVLRRDKIVLLYLASEEARASISTFPRRELLMIYTPNAVCRGCFHVPAEANFRDFLDVMTMPLLPLAEVRVFPFVELPAPFSLEPELLLIGRQHVMFYHAA